MGKARATRHSPSSTNMVNGKYLEVVPVMASSQPCSSSGPISWAYSSDLYGVRMTLSPRCIVSFTDRTERTPAREACTRVMLA